MDRQRRAWDLEYAKPHPLWKGVPHEVGMPPGTGRVLELGCGNGKTLAALMKGGSEVVGVDFSRNGLRACARSVPAPPDLVQADLRWLPFAGDSFDHVVAFHVLGHLPAVDRPIAVGEIRRVLRPGGGLLVRVFSGADMRCGQGEEVEPRTFMKGTGIPCHYFEKAELLDLLDGFRVLVLDGVKALKRYDGQEYQRAELVGAFQLR
jgi:SAM-dependent methyltransferase